MLDRQALESLLAPMVAAGQSQNAMARSLGLESSALSRWRTGGNASYPQVAAVAERLGVPVSRLWRGSVPRKYAAAPNVLRGTPGGPVAAAIDAAYARGYAAAEFSAIAAAAKDIMHRATIAAQRMAAATPPAGDAVPGEAAESQALTTASAGRSRRAPSGRR